MRGRESDLPRPQLPRLRRGAYLVRRAYLVAVLAWPFACSVYDASDLQGWERGGSGGGGASTTPPLGTAGNPPNGGGGSATAGGGKPDGGRGGAGGALTGGSSAMGASSPGGAGAAPGAAGEGGATSEPPIGGAGAGEAGAGGEPSITGLVAAYPCDGANGASLPDASGRGRTASLANGSGGGPSGFTFGDGVVGKALRLRSSARAHVQLPRGIVAGLSELTIATWIQVESSAAFQRIFDFGSDTGTFMYLVSAGPNGMLRFRITSDSPNRNQVVEGGKALPVGEWAHVAVTLGERGVSLYLDGSQIAQQAPAAMRPSDLGDTGNNFIGRSPFASDPYLDGQIDEFEIYDHALSAAEIERLAQRP